MLSVSLTRKVSLLQACKEDDCPDIETAITLMRPKPREKLLFKIYKPAAEMIREDGVIELTCDYCGKQYALGKTHLEGLLAES